MSLRQCPAATGAATMTTPTVRKTAGATGAIGGTDALRGAVSWSVERPEGLLCISCCYAVRFLSLGRIALYNIGSYVRSSASFARDGCCELIVRPLVSLRGRESPPHAAVAVWPCRPCGRLAISNSFGQGRAPRGGATAADPTGPCRGQLAVLIGASCAFCAFAPEDFFDCCSDRPPGSQRGRIAAG